MDDSPEMIRQRMEETRTSLTDKLETLEHQVTETVQGAKSAVTDTVATVKEAVHDTVESVKDTFDIRHQVERRPWAMLGGSVALGFIGAHLLDRLNPERDVAKEWPRVPATYEAMVNGHKAGEFPVGRPTEGAAQFDSSPSCSTKETEPGWLGSLTSEFGPEISKLKGLAVGAALGVARDMIVGAAPDPMKPQLVDVIDSVTAKLGGQPIRGQLLQSKDQERPYSQGDYHEKREPSEMGRSLGPT